MPDDAPRLRPASNVDLRARLDAFSYQLQAVEAVRGLSYAALLHEQGLGKTKIGIDLALDWLRDEAVDTVLFVTKRSLVQNWLDEIAQHAHIRAHALGQDRGSNFYALNSPVRLLVAHYEVLKSEERRLALFQKTRRVAAILDEAQKIKNPDADLTKAALRLGPGFARRVVMTGTPVANRPYDLWAPIAFLDGGEALGDDFEAFRAGLDLTNDLWRDPDAQAELTDRLATVFERIRPFTVRETKRSAGLALPEKIVTNVPVQLGEEQRALYERIRTEMRAEVVRHGVQTEDNSEAVLKRLLRLVQVASDPRLVDEAFDAEPAKLVPLLAKIDNLVAKGEKAIVWTSFVDTASRLTAALAAHGAVVVHGRLGIDERNAAISRFKTDAGCKVLVATPGAAKEGLTLTVANHAIFHDRSFSLDDYLQAQDRIHRISQTRTSHVWNLVAADTIDEWIDALLAAKRLAAQLAQADITRAEYEAAANYDFGRMIGEILGVEE